LAALMIFCPLGPMNFKNSDHIEHTSCIFPKNMSWICNLHLYMHIFRRIFLSNYWWQESDIWSQTSYRYAILWEAFLDPFADFDDFSVETRWTVS
jgi:hypothetical protein